MVHLTNGLNQSVNQSALWSRICKYSISVCRQTVVASDVIFGVGVDEIGMDICVKFGSFLWKRFFLDAIRSFRSNNGGSRSSHSAVELSCFSQKFLHAARKSAQ